MKKEDEEPNVGATKVVWIFLYGSQILSRKFRSGY